MKLLLPGAMIGDYPYMVHQMAWRRNTAVYSEEYQIDNAISQRPET